METGAVQPNTGFFIIAQRICQLCRYIVRMCNKKASIYELNWKIYSISHASYNIFDGFDSIWFIHLQVGDSKDFSIDKSIYAGTTIYYVSD